MGQRLPLGLRSSILIGVAVFGLGCVAYWRWLPSQQRSAGDASQLAETKQSAPQQQIANEVSEERQQSLTPRATENKTGIRALPPEQTKPLGASAFDPEGRPDRTPHVEDADLLVDKRAAPLSSNSPQLIRRDCPGQLGSQCPEVARLAEKIIGSPDFGQDGWSEWMEREILASLLATAEENRLTHVGVKCSLDGCVFKIEAKNGVEVFEHGFDSHDIYDRWLRNRPWVEELASNKTTGGSGSVFAWQIVGRDVSPFVTWYIVRRRQ